MDLDELYDKWRDAPPRSRQRRDAKRVYERALAASQAQGEHDPTRPTHSKILRGGTKGERRAQRRAKARRKAKETK